MANPFGQIDREILSHYDHMKRLDSKSFSWVSRLFPKSTRIGATFLYGWCRYCDDQIGQAISNDDQKQAIVQLRNTTLSSYRMEKRETLIPAFFAFQRVVHAFQIPKEYPDELLKGFEMDVCKQKYKTIQDLELYCFRTAGTIGLMMSHIMGVSNIQALDHAVHLAIGIQLTNIARDFASDAKKGRVYLPLSWLREFSLTDEDIIQCFKSDPSDQKRQHVYALVTRLVELSKKHYQYGNLGLRFLPLRSALAVATASEIHSDIGKLILKRGSMSLSEGGISVSPYRKLRAILIGLMTVTGSIPSRIINPFSPVQIHDVWRYSG